MQRRRDFQPGPGDQLHALTEGVIGAAIEVHRHLGPGLLESAYEACLFQELVQRGYSVIRQFPLPLIYKGQSVDCGYRLDLLINDVLIVELKSVEELSSIHRAQMITYLKVSKRRVGLVINFNVYRLVDGVMRVILDPPAPQSTHADDISF